MEITRKVTLTVEQIVSVRAMLKSELVSTLATGFRAIALKEDMKEPLSAMVHYAAQQMDIFHELDRLMETSVLPYREMSDSVAATQLQEKITLFFPTAHYDELVKIIKEGAWIKALQSQEDVPAASVGALLLKNKPGIILAFENENYEFFFNMQTPKGVVQ